jgi:D-alanyl-D-alanine dipeptidase
MKIVIFFIIGIFFFLFPIFGVRALGCCELYDSNGTIFCFKDENRCRNPGTGLLHRGEEWIPNGMCSGSACISNSTPPPSKDTTSSSSEFESPDIFWTPQITVPFSEFRKGETLPITDSLVARYVVAIFSFVVILGGFLAFVRAVISGAQWALAAGDSGKITAAKEALKNSLIGLVVILSSYQILQLLSINLTRFPNLTIESVRAVSLDVIRSVSSETSSEQEFDKGGKVLDKYMSYCPGVSLQEIKTNGKLFVAARDKKVNSEFLTQKILEDAANAVWNETGKKLVISSAIRMVKDQELLHASWLCFRRSTKNDLTDEEKKTLKQIRDKYPRDSSCTQKSQAAKPNCEKSPHLIGKAIDVTLKDSSIEGKANQEAKLSQDDRALIYKLQKAMHSKKFKHICNEWWHFEIQGKRDGGYCDVGCHNLTDDNKVGGDKKKCWDEKGEFISG